MIRTGTADTATFGYRMLSLSKNMRIPVGQIRLAGDSTLMLFDADGKLCKADLNTMTSSHAAPGDFKFSQIGSFGLIHCTDGKGYVFHLSMVNNQAIHSRFIPIFVVSGNKRYLYQWFKPDLLEMNIMPYHQAIPDMDNPEFLRQFNIRYDIDKLCSGAIISDMSGDLWAGTNGYGLRILREEKTGISKFASHISFSNFVCLHNDQIWPGHFNHNLVYSLETNHPEKAPWVESLPEHTRMNSLYMDKGGNFWALTSKAGEYTFRKYTVSTGKWSILPVFAGRINGDRSVITGDKNGNVWLLAGNARIIRINPATDVTEEWNIGSLFPSDEINQFQSYSAATDDYNNLWIGTSCGLLRIDCSTEKPSFQSFHNFTSKGVLFASNHLLSVYPDRNDRYIVWVGTKGGGLCKLDIVSGKTQTFTTHDGLTDNVIYGILPDVTGKLWISTNRGISCYDPATGRCFNPFPGVSAMNVEFNTGAYRLMGSGKLAFGSVDGLFIIDPLQFVNDAPEIKVAVSGLKIKGADFNAPENAGFVTFNEQNECRIDIPYSSNNISVSFVALPKTRNNRSYTATEFPLSTAIGLKPVPKEQSISPVLPTEIIPLKFRQPLKMATGLNQPPCTCSYGLPGMPVRQPGLPIHFLL
jgi:sugar lactone lactonase YvrE